MPRSGWLAIGAVVAAWSVPIVGRAWVEALAAILGALALLAWGRGSGRRAQPLLVALIGAMAIVLRSTLAPSPVVPTVVLDGRGPWTMTVASVGSARAGQQVATLRLEPGPDATLSAVLVAATLPAYPEVGPGDRVTIDSPIEARPDSAYGVYLERIGAVGTVTARSMTVERAPMDLAHAIDRAREVSGAALTAVLPEPEAGLAAGILIGLRDRVDRDLAAAFTTAGVSHVVAISGWNIAIVAASVAAVTGRLRRRHRSIVTMLVIVAYVLFAGASASVVRAGAMAGVVLLARESGRAGRAAAALGWAAVILLTTDPGLVGDAGFQLSTLATAGLIAWATPLTAWFERGGRGRVPHWLAESLGVSTAAQAATLPIILVSFGRLAILSPVVNLVVVPLVAPAMAVGLVAMLGGFLVLAGAPSLVGGVLAAAGWVALRAMVGIVETAAALPFASVTLAAPWSAIAAVAALLLVIGLDVRWRRSSRWPAAPPAMPPPPAALARSAPGAMAANTAGRKAGQIPGRPPRWAVLVLVGTVAVAGAVVASRPEGVARISVLDVGQGDAILVEGSRGGRLLIDGGPDPGRLLIALDSHVPPWDRRLDGVILTHPHEDHVAGLARLLDRYRVARVFEPGMRGPGPGYAAWLARLTAGNGPLRLGLAAGDALQVDDIDLRVLWPIRGQVPLAPPDTGTGINNVSIVLLGSVGSARFMLAGDVEQDIDPSLLADDLPRLDFLKVAHHGSKTATTQPFVDAVRPRVAVASAGTGNPYGHPAASTLQRLADAGAQVYRTDRDGTVVATFGADGMRVRAEGGRAASGPGPDAAPLAASGPGPAVGLAGTASAGIVTPVDPRLRAVAFRCATPVTGLVPERDAPPASTRPTPAVPGVGGPAQLGYHRVDDRAGAGGGRLPPAVPRPAPMVRAARPSRGRGRRLPRRADRRPRDRAGSAAGRVGRPAARRRQDAPAGRSGSRAPPR